MPHLTRSTACAVALIALAALAPARADDVETVKEKLFQAKKLYDGESRKFRASVTDALDKREDAARKAGDKKAVDAVKGERDRFEKEGELPPATAPAARDQMKAARAKLDKAYTATVKDLTKLKEDAAAEAVEKEQTKFNLDASLLFGKRAYLASLKHFDVKAHENWFTNDGTVAGSGGKKRPLLNGGSSANSLYMVPFDSGTAQVKYTLGGKATALRATVGVPKFADTTAEPASAVTFEVVGDEKSLWKSKPITKTDEFQLCEVSVEKVKVLTLKVHCEKSYDWARAMWLEPIVTE